MTDAEVLAVQRIAATPAQRLIVALAAVHAARATAIRHLTLDDLDPPNRRITIARHTQRLGELPHQTLLAWLAQRRTAWPKTPNRHVLINAKTALGTGPVSPEYLKRHLLHQGVHLERIRGDRVLHEALTVGADPLHLGLGLQPPRSCSTTSLLALFDLGADPFSDQSDACSSARPSMSARGVPVRAAAIRRARS
ncbi:hypothetical protein [Streptomyces sp. WAC00263]|uniref:hypothetical protein n=1 Tax=Streptomyces sp. WAC00263 TaxID=1917422 RepID=UPI0015EF35E4|nr:hypothetical protein [Streptomyces sp. WAC00263]